MYRSILGQFREITVVSSDMTSHSFRFMKTSAMEFDSQSYTNRWSCLTFPLDQLITRFRIRVYHHATGQTSNLNQISNDQVELVKTVS